MAIHFAVQTLSPVNIHIFTPPILKASMVKATSSWSLSYTPVIPTKSIYFSNCSITLFIQTCLSLRRLLAYSYYSLHLSYSYFWSYFWVITNVLNPSLARLSHQSWMYPRQIALHLSIMTISAPLRYKINLSVSMCLTIIPILLVSLENGKFAKISYYYLYSVGSSIENVFFPLYLSINPSYSANLTKAISSGLEACNILTPSSVTGVTLLHKINAVAKSL